MSMHKSKALFLDRDGVINVEQCYVHCRQHFHFREGIFELCRAAQNLGYVLLVVTNQAGIARGYYTETEFLELTKWMIHKFAEQQIQIARVYYCPYHPVHGRGRYKYDSPDRKPKPGMYYAHGQTLIWIYRRAFSSETNCQILMPAKQPELALGFCLNQKLPRLRCRTVISILLIPSTKSGPVFFPYVPRGKRPRIPIAISKSSS